MSPQNASNGPANSSRNIPENLRGMFPALLLYFRFSELSPSMFFFFKIQKKKEKHCRNSSGRLFSLWKEDELQIHVNFRRRLSSGQRPLNLTTCIRTILKIWHKAYPPWMYFMANFKPSEVFSKFLFDLSRSFLHTTRNNFGTVSLFGEHCEHNVTSWPDGSLSVAFPNICETAGSEKRLHAKTHTIWVGFWQAHFFFPQKTNRGAPLQ